MKNTKINEIKYAFQQSIPVLLGYIFMGIAFGLLLQKEGYGPLWAIFISVTVYSGSMQFVLVPLIANSASLISVFIMTLFINGRHIFYGFSLINKFKEFGWKAYTMMFELTDETYSVFVGMKAPEGANEENIMFHIALFNHLYWITGCFLGALIGELISFNSTGVDFAMTALFIVIVVNQWLENKEHRPAIVGAIVGVVTLLILGPDKFIVPALAISSLILIGVRKKWAIQ